MNLPASLNFTHLTVSDWRQFGQVDIEFHPRLTVLTGANASGKSTLLGILARHLNWNRLYSSSPGRASEGQSWRSFGPRRMKRFLEEGGSWADVGELTYSNGVATKINVPVVGTTGREGYDLNLPNQQEVRGVFLNSHRPTNGNYIQLPSIPTVFTDPDQLFERYTDELRTQWLGSWSGRSSQLALKEALVAAAVFGGEGNEFVDPNPEAAEIWNGFQHVIAAVSRAMSSCPPAARLSAHWWPAKLPGYGHEICPQM